MTQEYDILKASRLAHTAHRGQCRRDGRTPYIIHVASVVERVGDDPLAAMAAWLHDIIEDTDTTAEELLDAGIPEDVVALVILLTHEKGEPYLDYLDRVMTDPVAKSIKIADMLANLGDQPTNRQIIKYCRGLIKLLGADS